MEKLEQAFGWEWSDVKECDYEGINNTSSLEVPNKKPDFVKRKAMLRNSPGEIAKKNVIVALHAGDLKTSQWFLERRNMEFSSKKQVDIAVSHQLDAGQITEQLQQYIDNAKKKRASGSKSVLISGLRGNDEKSS